MTSFQQIYAYQRGAKAPTWPNICSFCFSFLQAKIFFLPNKAIGFPPQCLACGRAAL